jgi:hypothetical protein
MSLKILLATLFHASASHFSSSAPSHPGRLRKYSEEYVFASNSADNETMVGRAEQEHAGLLFAETCIKPSIAAPNGLRWFRL